MDMPM